MIGHLKKRENHDNFVQIEIRVFLYKSASTSSVLNLKKQVVQQKSHSVASY